MTSVHWGMKPRKKHLGNLRNSMKGKYELDLMLTEIAGKVLSDFNSARSEKDQRMSPREEEMKSSGIKDSGTEK